MDQVVVGLVAVGLAAAVVTAVVTAVVAMGIILTDRRAKKEIRERATRLARTPVTEANRRDNLRSKEK